MPIPPREKVDRTAEEPKVPFETAIIRQPGNVPFATHHRAVTGTAKDFGKCHVSGSTQILGLLMPQSRQQRRSCFAALGVVVKVCQPQPASGEPIQMRRRDLAAKATEIRVAHVIANDHDDVRSIVGTGSLCKHQQRCDRDRENKTIHGCFSFDRRLAKFDGLLANNDHVIHPGLLSNGQA